MPSCGIDPAARCASPNDVTDAAYRNATSGSDHPASESTCENISRIPTKSIPVSTRLPNRVKTNDVR